MTRRKSCNDFPRGLFADVAVAIPDAALRQSVLASAVAAFCIEFVQRGGSLLRREFRKIHARKLRGAVSVLQKDLSCVVEGFHSYIANRQA